VTGVNLIANTKTKSGMNRRCIEDKKQYEKGIKIKSDELENVTIEQDAFHREWNYTIKNIGNVICARLLNPDFTVRSFLPLQVTVSLIPIVLLEPSGIAANVLNDNPP
jgi:hypothetical protein